MSARYLPEEIHGYSGAFDRYGDWRHDPAYGYVWYPRVTVAWRPYHHGSWRHYGPWGWTWIAYDPWWGWVGEVAVPTNRLSGSVSLDAAGVNAGGGVSFQLQDRTRIFVEVRWHRAFHNPTNSTFVPFTVGISF